MDLRRLRAGEWALAGSGAVLLLSLFLPWYELPDEASWTAWEAFAVNDVLLALAGLLAAAVAVVTATQKTVAVPIALTSVAVVVCLAALILVAVRLLAEPAQSTGVEPGAWLGLAGALAMTAAAWVAVRDERLSRPGQTTDVTGRPSPPPPEIEAVPPPRPSG